MPAQGCSAQRVRSESTYIDQRQYCVHIVAADEFQFTARSLSTAPGPRTIVGRLSLSHDPRRYGSNTYLRSIASLHLRPKRKYAARKPEIAMYTFGCVPMF